MIGNLRPYPAYKDSGVPCLGKVPEHWDVRQLGQIGRLFKGIGGSKDDETQDGVPCIRYGDIYTTHEYFIKSSRSFVSVSKAQDYMPIKFGDVLFAASGETIDEIAKSAVNLLRTEGCCGSDIILFRNERQMEARFLGYLTDCRASIVQKAMMGRGITIIHIYKRHLKHLVVCLPPLFEQTAIVQFLNHIDQYIDRYIHAKQRLVKLLGEKRQAAIQHASTRGIDPNVRLKHSGIDWLGKVPIHWNIRRLGQIGRFFKSTGGSKEDEVSSGIPCIRYGDLYTTHDYHVSKNRSFIRTEISRDYTLIKFGDILFATSGETIDEIGKSAVNLMLGDVRCGGDVILFRPKCQVDARFMGYSTDSRLARIQKATMGRGITIMHIYAHQLKRLAIAIPPLAEQTAIASFLDQRTSEIDGAVKATQRQIDLLREYRTRLISDVVTGKLDVREAAAQLPKQLSETGSGDAAHAPPHMSTGSNRDSDASTEEDEP